jgi:glycosyltransferase involved in cell wall biosynthesis
MPVVSLVMATYNRAHTLARAIDSVLAQTFTDWQLIVVDDGSTDTSQAVLAKYSNDPRIQVVVHARNRGVLAAKNTGFDHATGTWLTTHDSDDEIVPDALAVLLRASETNPAIDVVGCNCREAVSHKPTATGINSDETLAFRDYRAKIRGETWGMFRRARLNNRRFNERIHGMEGVLWLQVLDGALCRYVAEALRVYHVEGNDRISVVKRTTRAREQRLYESYVAMIDDERDFLTLLGSVDRTAHQSMLGDAAMHFLWQHDHVRFDTVTHMLREAGHSTRALTLRAAWMAGPVARAGRAAWLTWSER